MKRSMCCVLGALLAGLAASVPAQESGTEHRHAMTAGEPIAGRPSADASPEEKRAFWQARAAARQTEGAESATAATTTGKPESRKPTAAGDAGQPVATAAGAGAGAGTGAGSVDAKDPVRGMRMRGAGGDALLWLSDQPPRREGGGGRPGGGKGAGTGMGEMGGMAMGDAVPEKRLWLRVGGDPQSARGLPASESALLLDASMQASELPVEAHGGPYNVSFPMPEPGVYNVYFQRSTLTGDTLEVTVAKAEVMRSAGHAAIAGEAQLMVPHIDTRVPVEIVRQRLPQEGLFTRISYGDSLTYQVLRGGKPVQNARVTFTSGQGWSKSQQTDEDGRASFVVVRDYFPAWPAFDRRHRETYLVSASFPIDQAGAWQGGAYRNVRYTTTLAGAYYPSVSDYESYAWGLGIALGVLFFSGSAVYLYRRRRLRPYREVRFDA